MNVNVNMSAEELNKFIGGDNEVALKLKHSIIQQFTSKYLKGIANVSLANAKEDVQKYINKQLCNKEWYSVIEKPSTQVRCSINREIRVRMTRLIEERISEYMKDNMKMLTEVTADLAVARFKENFGDSLLNKVGKLLDREIHQKGGEG